MADLQNLLFEKRARVTDREVLATARLNARVKNFAGREISNDTIVEINVAIADEVDRLIGEGILTDRPDWLAVLVGRWLHVAFGTEAVRQLSRDPQLRGTHK
jgi:hypothetical protein